MTAFISHSFQDKPEFQNVVDALDSKKVPYWNPAEIKPGASLREQLRAAVDQCDVCIFVATRHSVGSSWCGAELGAFWGAGKDVIVYLAEASLPDDELPPVVQGDVWERRILKIADRAAEIIAQARESAGGASARRASSVAQLTIEEFENLIRGTVSLAAASTKDDTASENLRAVESAVTAVAGKVLTGFQAAGSVAATAADDWRSQILWVDDNPKNNVYERHTLESMGLKFTLALSTSEALKVLGTRRFAAIISDMQRKEGPREGYVLLEAVRATDDATPFFLYTGSAAAQHRREAALRGAQGATNNPGELVEMVAHALPRRTESGMHS